MAESIIKGDNSGWKTLNSSITYYRKNGIVIVSIDSTSVNLGASWANLGTLPEGYRPSITMYTTGTNYANTTDSVSVGISSNGIISARLQNGATSKSMVLGATLVFPAN